MKTKYFLLLLIPLSLFLYISFFCNPIADDFTFAVILRNNSVWEGTKSLYLGITGRYFSNFLMLINPIAFNLFWLYKILPVFIISITLGVVFYFFKNITQNKFKPLEYFIASIVLVQLYLFKMPNLAEGIYWYTGYGSYHLSLVFLLAYLISIIKLNNTSGIIKVIWHVLSVILLFATMGFNEVVTAIALLLLFLINYIQYKKIGRINYLLIHLFLAAAFTAMVLFAPGSWARDNHYLNNHQVLYSLKMSLFQTIRFIANWISASLLLLSLIYIPINHYLSQKVLLFKKAFYLTPKISVMLLGVVVFVSAFLPYYATGILGQHRTMNTAYFLFLILWFVNLTVFYNHYSVNINKRASSSLLKIGLVLLFLQLSFTHNSYSIISDIFYKKHIAFNKQMQERYTQIENAKSDTIYLKPISKIPESVFVLDITYDPNHWLNRGYLIYFDKKNKTIVKDDHITPCK